MTASAPSTASVHVHADPERVFDYFTRPEAIVRWMGDYALLEPTPAASSPSTSTACRSAAATLRSTGPPAAAQLGHAGSDRLPPGASTLQVTLTPRDGGTTVTIVRAGLPAPEDRQHRLGWPHFLDRLVIAAAGGDPGPDPWAATPPATTPHPTT